MSRRARVRRYTSKTVTAIGLFIIALIGLFGISYMLLGNVVANAEVVHSIQAFTASASAVNVSNVEKKADKLSFTLASTAAYLKIQLKETWRELKGMFTGMYIDLKGIEDVAKWVLAKIYLSDGSTELYVGSISYDKGSASFDVVVDDYKGMNDFQPVTVIIKFFDQNGELVNALAADSHTIYIKLTMPIKTDTITAFATSLIMSFIIALRRFVSALTASFSSFLLAITTNSAILTLLGAVAIVSAWWFLSERRRF